MKPNKPVEWIIDFHGGTKRRPQVRTEKFFGTIDAALAEADELESEVTFVVTQIVLTRGKRTRPI